jgi:hypothetical protein
MAAINVKLVAGQFEISGQKMNFPNTNVPLTVDKLYSNFIEAYGLTDNELKGITDNQSLQSSLNCGDSIKDGTNQAVLQNLSLFPNDKGIVRFTYDDLKKFVHHVEEQGLKNGYVNLKKFVRNKASVKSLITKQHISTQYQVVFDAATSLEQFFVNPSLDLKKFESIGKYLDPSTTRDSDFIFPDKGQPLIINPGVFVNLGYTNECILSAVANAKDNYKYDMTIYGEQFVKNDAAPKNADTIRNEICGGNNVKKDLLKSGISTQRKRTIVVAKGWGDKLQVFIAFIYKLTGKAPSGVTVAVATCDEIVYNLCCYFGVNCLLTSTGVGTIEGETKIQKINKILHYDPEGSNPAQVLENLKNRFNTEKASILGGYEDFIGLINRLATSGQEPELSVNGTGTKYRFSADYYGLISQDLQANLDIVIGIPFDESTPQIANQSIEELRKYTVNSFIKEFQPGQYRLASAASSYNIHSHGKEKLAFAGRFGPSVRNKPFLTLASTHFRIQGGGSAYSENKQVGGMLNDKDYIYFMNDYKPIDGAQKGFEIIFDKRNTFDSNIDNEITVDDVMPIDPIQPEPEPLPDIDNAPETINGIIEADDDDSPDGVLIEKETRRFDAIENLYQEIKNIFNKQDPEIQKHTFYSFWNEMMLRLEANPDYSTDSLNAYAEEIKTEFLSIESEQPAAILPMETLKQPQETVFSQQPDSQVAKRRKMYDENKNKPNNLSNVFAMQVTSGGKKSKNKTRKYVEKTNKKTKRSKRSKSKKTTTKSKTRKYHKKRLS